MVQIEKKKEWERTEDEETEKERTQNGHVQSPNQGGMTDPVEGQAKRRRVDEKQDVSKTTRTQTF